MLLFQVLHRRDSNTLFLCILIITEIKVKTFGGERTTNTVNFYYFCNKLKPFIQIWSYPVRKMEKSKAADAYSAVSREPWGSSTEPSGPMEPVCTPLHQYKQDSNLPLLNWWRREKCESLLSINDQYLCTYAFIYVLQMAQNLLKEMCQMFYLSWYNYGCHIFSVFSKWFFIKSRYCFCYNNKKHFLKI